MPSPSHPPRLLLLFEGAWEHEAVHARRQRGEIVLEREGFESLGFPGVLRLIGFDAPRYLQRLVGEYRGRIDGVWSNDDQFGCLLAAMVARELGLPGADPAAIVRAQHKLLLRQALAVGGTEGNVTAAALPWSFADRRLRQASAIDGAVADLGLRWPLFCKPVKGTFSAFARRVASAEELAAHSRLPWSDRFLLRRWQRPFAQLAAAVMPLPCPPDRILLEEPLVGQQVNVDGYACRGAVRVLGIVDEWTYAREVAGARHFAGFSYPSRLPSDTRQRIAATAAHAVRAVGYDHGLWNVELFVQPDGRVRTIEINPRSAGQFSTLYRDVDGIDMEGIAMALAVGADPEEVPRRSPIAGAAASFVFRRFDGEPGPMPTEAAQRWLAVTHANARLWLEPGGGGALRREYRWFGSHRFAVLNHAAADFPALLQQGAECGARLFGAAALPLD